MTTHFGKRNPGALTASSPGDTLYIPLQFYNDSGASISIGSSLAVTDIELFKNGGVVERATDSGYAILGDTGNFDSRIGFKGISVSLFNTADDTGFYDIGSTYWVAIDSVTVDARTVRFFPATFEIGEPRANIVQIDGDTGAADRLQKFAETALAPDGDLDTGSGGVAVALINDTGSISNAVWDSTQTVHNDTGTLGREMQLAGAILVDTTITGTPSSTSLQLTAGSSVDNFYNDQLLVITSGTGVGQARIVKSYTGATKTITVDEAFVTTPASGARIVVRAIHVHPITQIVDAIWDEADTGHSDTGTFGRLRQGVNVNKIVDDTGAASQLQKAFATMPTYFQQVDLQQIDGDTGAADVLQKFADTTGALSPAGELDTGSGTVNASVTALSDTGVNNRLAVILADTDTGIQSSVNVTALSDTGVNERLNAIETKTNSLGFTVAGQVDANIQYVNDVAIQGTGDTGTADTWRPA